MGIEYRKDDDLDFLQYCGENDLQILARYMTHDKDGDMRSTSDLLEDKEFKRHTGKQDQYKLCWQLIAGELQHFGGDSFVSFFRGNGVAYKEILSDVCEKLNVKFNKKSSVYEIENQLLEKLMNDSWEKMDDKQREELLKDIGLNGKLTGSAGLFALLAAVQMGGVASYVTSGIIASTVAEAFAGSALTFAAGSGVARGLSVLAGPIGIAVVTLLTVPAISGAAYRVTIPSVCQIAYMRRAYAEQQHF